MPFIPSLTLSQMLYEQRIEPLLAQRFPGVPYAAATLGMCSEVLGLDDEISMDHEWGPRIRIYLSERDHARYADQIRAALKESLPDRFAGLEMIWSQPGADLHDTRERALYHIPVGTLSDTLAFRVGVDALPLGDLDWLRVSEQHLLEFTAGVVYRDDLGELTEARALLARYPDSVLCFLLTYQWGTLNADWWPIGRMGTRGDMLGVRLHAARAADGLMRIAFMVSRRYMPYRKWFGTLFKRLPIASALEPVLSELLQESDWRRVEEQMVDATALLVEEQNKLGLAEPISVRPQPMDDGRHHVNGGYADISQALSQALEPSFKALIDNQVFWLHERRLILTNGEVGKWALLLQK
jgi:hypothetical protein